MVKAHPSPQTTVEEFSKSTAFLYGMYWRGVNVAKLWNEIYKREIITRPSHAHMTANRVWDDFRNAQKKKDRGTKGWKEKAFTSWQVELSQLGYPIRGTSHRGVKNRNNCQPSNGGIMSELY